MFDKMVDWVENLRDWVYSKKPRNKYLRIAYYSLTGLIYSVSIILLTLIATAFVGGALGAFFWLVEYLISVEDYVHLAMKVLAGFLFLLAVSVIGYFEFGDD